MRSHVYREQFRELVVQYIREPVVQYIVHDTPRKGYAVFDRKPCMEPIRIDDVIDRLEREDELFVEFLRRESLSLEAYRLQAGATDPQDPHTEDEVYYVVSGSAKIRIGDDVHPVEKGDVVFVERGVEHYFLDIEEELVTLIFFAPPYGSLAED